VYGNAEDGPWGPSGPCPAVSLDLSVTRSLKLGTEVSFFMGTQMDLRVGNGLELALQATSHELEDALKVEVKQLSAVSSNFTNGARLLRMASRLHRLRLGSNFHS